MNGQRRETTLAELECDQSRLSMAQEAATAIGKRIALHLHRGSIEQARDALEEAWASHLADQDELPIGPELLSEPISRVLDDVRTLNCLEEEGILTVADLLKTSSKELFRIPNIGPLWFAKLADLCRCLRERSEISPCCHSDEVLG